MIDNWMFNVTAVESGACFDTEINCANKVEECEQTYLPISA